MYAPPPSGLDVDLPAPSDPADAKFGPLAALFAEELGWVLEVASADADAVVKAYRDAGVEARVVGKTLAGGDVTFKVRRTARLRPARSHSCCGWARET